MVSFFFLLLYPCHTAYNVNLGKSSPDKIGYKSDINPIQGICFDYAETKLHRLNLLHMCLHISLINVLEVVSVYSRYRMKYEIIHKMNLYSGLFDRHKLSL